METINDLLDVDRWKLLFEVHLPQLISFNFQFHCSHIYADVLEGFLTSPWFVACDTNFSCHFTVLFFASTLIHYPLVPVAADLTTLLLNSPSINERVLDLAKVQSLIVNNSDWSLSMIVELLKESMSTVNYLSLNGNYSGRHNRVFPTISLPQIRILKRRCNFSLMKPSGWRSPSRPFQRSHHRQPLFSFQGTMSAIVCGRRKRSSLCHICRRRLRDCSRSSPGYVNTHSFQQMKSHQSSLLLFSMNH